MQMQQDKSAILGSLVDEEEEEEDANMQLWVLRKRRFGELENGRGRSALCNGRLAVWCCLQVFSTIFLHMDGRGRGRTDGWVAGLTENLPGRLGA